MSSLLIDSHCHVQFQAYNEDRDEVIRRTLAENVWMITVGTRYDTSKNGVDLAHRYSEGLFATAGIHPIHVEKPRFVDPQELPPSAPESEEIDWGKFEELGRDPKVVAIGECGLDYWKFDERLKEEAPRLKEKQREIFLKQLEMARKLKKPIAFHCRAAYEDLYEILKEIKGKEGRGGELKGVVHFFTGSYQMGKKFLELGFFLAFPGVITYARDYDKIIRETPLEQLLIETDAPYAAPEPYRGQRNEPRYVRYVAEKLAEIKNLRSEEIIEATTHNAKTLFRIH